MSDRERQIPHNIIYMWNLKHDTNALIYKTEIDSQTEIRLVVAKRGRGDSEDGWIGSLQLAAANYYIQDR